MKIKVKFETFDAGKVTLEWNTNLLVLGPNQNKFSYQKMWLSWCKESKFYSLPFRQAVVSIYQVYKVYHIRWVDMLFKNYETILYSLSISMFNQVND